jgi:hypothetical protein
MKSLHGGSSHHKERTPSSYSQHNSIWRRTLVETNGNDQVLDPSDFEDVRCEIQATGYHLVRITSFSLFDSFSIVFLSVFF